MTISLQKPLGSGFDASSTAREVMDGVDLTGRTAVVTGGYSGLGLETTRALIAAGARVIVPARRPELAAERLTGLDDSRVRVDAMDLADLASVADFARDLTATTERVDLLIAAAGVMATPERRVGPGWESQFATNHLGHFALVNLLRPLFSRGARVITYSSAGHHLSDIRWDDLHFANGYDKWLAYGQAKTANVLFAAQLDALGRGEDVRAFSLHPGAIITDLQRDLSTVEQVERGWIDTEGNVIGAGFKTAEQGAATGLWAATSAQLDGLGGLYCEDCDLARLADPEDSMGDGGVQPYALDADGARRLWALSTELIGIESGWTVD